MAIDMTAQAAQREYFNLHTNGIGYLNRVRWVETKGRGRRSDPFLACSIYALRGSSDEVQYMYFDLRVSGKNAIELIESLHKEVNENRKVLVSFRIADIYPHTYERRVLDSQRRPTGEMEQAALIKGRLILIHSVKVDGVPVYTRNEDTSANEAEPQHEQEAGSFEDTHVNNAPAAQHDQGYAPRPPVHRRPQNPAGYGQPRNHRRDEVGFL